MGIMKLSDYVVEYLTRLNIKHIFVIQGGAVAHLIDSLEKNDKIEYVTCQHEQACSMAADSYSRIQSSIGVAMATSGPGATNLITGIANAFYDSIPTLFITGNVTSFRQSTNLGIRQYGFQETDIVSITKAVTKYSEALKDPYDIDILLSQAVYEALSGRKGPVLIDIPDDFQRLEIDTSKLKKFIIPQRKKSENIINIDQIHKLLINSKRPVLIYGSGILSDDSSLLAVDVTSKLNIPTIFSWPVKGIFDYENELNFGSFGTNSLRSGNFIVQNSDLLIVIGNRLDTHATGKLDQFAREAKTVVVDIDLNELSKFEYFGKKIDYKICSDAQTFFKELLTLPYRFSNAKWIEYCKNLKSKSYADNLVKSKKVSPGLFFEKLSKILDKNTIFIGDTGANLVYLFNGIKEKKGQKFISAFNNTPMGYSIAAAIGVAFGTKNKKIVCCIGDGGLQMNIQELATIKYYNLPIVIIVFNNRGHGMIKQTQDDWFASQYSASSKEKGIPSVNFANIARGYGIKSIQLNCDLEVHNYIKDMTFSEPVLVELILDEDLRINPMLKFGRPLEDMNPLLSREEFFCNMIINALPVSKES